MRFLLAALIFLTGCTTVQISNYIPADHAQSRRIYANYDKVLASVREVLEREHFPIKSEVNPAVYERDERYERPGSRNVLILTEIKEMRRIAYTKYLHLNVYVRSLADSVEVEIRYAKSTSVLIKQFRGTKNNRYIDHLLDEIEDEVNSK